MSSRVVAGAVIAAVVFVGAAAAGFVVSRDDGPSCDGTSTLDGVVFERAEVELTAADSTPRSECVAVATSPAQRSHGLMRVTDLGDDVGMVFAYTADSTGQFWMRNTVMPLSIAWFAADGTFVSAADMEPCADGAADCPLHGAAAPYRYALEVPKGDLPGLGVGPGSRLRLVTD
jgi:uncharacterized membrane protein (UPF0127 family)